MSSKGKKKKGTAISLGEFHARVESTTSSTGGQQQSASSSNNAPSGMSWAEEMEYVESSNKPSQEYFAEIRAQLPTAPKAALAPDLNMDAVPKNPPFTAHLSNVSFEADENKIRAFFLDSKILNVRLPVDERGRFRGFGQVDFENRESLISALAKNETKLFNRPLKVQLDSQPKREGGSERRGYGERQGYGAAGGGNPDSTSDDVDWRARPAQPEPESEQQLPPKSYSFSNRPNNRYNSQQGASQGGPQQQQQQRRTNWQPRGGGNDDGRPSHYQPRGDRDQQQSYSSRPSNDYGNRPRYDMQRNSGDTTSTGVERSPSTTNQAQSPPGGAPASSTSELKERPRVILAPRTIPVEPASEAPVVSSDIFGAAKPVNTAAKEREIEEKLARKREAEAAEKEREREQKEAEASQNAASEEKAVELPKHHERSHKTSFTSDDGNKHSSNKSNHENEFQTVGKPRHQKSEARGSGGAAPNNARLSQSNSFTSPPGGSRPYDNNRTSQRGSGDHHSPQQPPAWKGKPASSELFTAGGQPVSAASEAHDPAHQSNTRPNRNQTQATGGSSSSSSNSGARQFVNSKYQNSRPLGTNRDNTTNKEYQKRPLGDRNNKTASRGGRNEGSRGSGANHPTGDRFVNNVMPVQEVPETAAAGKIENKFAALAIDVDGDEEYDDNDDYDHDEDEGEQQQEHGHEQAVAAN